jgi:hypothetical protein
LITKFIPFDVMKIESKAYLKQFTRTLINDLLPLGYSITWNVAHKGGTSKMYAMGWRHLKVAFQWDVMLFHQICRENLEDFRSGKII